VCGAESLFVHVIFVPLVIVIVDGENLKFKIETKEFVGFGGWVGEGAGVGAGVGVGAGLDIGTGVGFLVITGAGAVLWAGVSVTDSRL